MFQAKEMGEHFLMEEERRDDDVSDGEVFPKKAQVFVISRTKAIALAGAYYPEPSSPIQAL